jgi:acid stress-induced BolA-like protein IbaG/YrbA
MDINDVKSAITGAIPDADIEISGEGCNFTVLVVSEAFRGLLPVKRQQMVLGALSDYLASGALHAITLKTLTPDEPRPIPPAPAEGLISLSH